MKRIKRLIVVLVAGLLAYGPPAPAGTMKTGLQYGGGAAAIISLGAFIYHVLHTRQLKKEIALLRSEAAMPGANRQLEKWTRYFALQDAQKSFQSAKAKQVVAGVFLGLGLAALGGGVLMKEVNEEALASGSPGLRPRRDLPPGGYLTNAPLKQLCSLNGYFQQEVLPSLIYPHLRRENDISVVSTAFHVVENPGCGACGVYALAFWDEYFRDREFRQGASFLASWPFPLFAMSFNSVREDVIDAYALLSKELVPDGCNPSWSQIVNNEDLQRWIQRLSEHEKEDFLNSLFGTVLKGMSVENIMHRLGLATYDHLSIEIDAEKRAALKKEIEGIKGRKGRIFIRDNQIAVELRDALRRALTNCEGGNEDEIIQRALDARDVLSLLCGITKKQLWPPFAWLEMYDFIVYAKMKKKPLCLWSQQPDGNYKLLSVAGVDTGVPGNFDFANVRHVLTQGGNHWVAAPLLPGALEQITQGRVASNSFSGNEDDLSEALRRSIEDAEAGIPARQSLGAPIPHKKDE